MSSTLYCSACGQPLPHLPPVTCPACGTDHWRDPKPCASGLVTDQGRLLMVRRAQEPWSGCWDVPGGFCGTDEHPITAAEREVLEETGLAIRITGILGMWIDEYGPVEDESRRKSTLNIYFHAVPSGEPHLNINQVEVVEAGWFKPDGLPQEIAFPDHIVPALRAWRQAFLSGQTVTPLLDRPR